MNTMTQPEWEITYRRTVIYLQHNETTRARSVAQLCKVRWIWGCCMTVHKPPGFVRTEFNTSWAATQQLTVFLLHCAAVGLFLQEETRSKAEYSLCLNRKCRRKQEELTHFLKSVLKSPKAAPELAEVGVVSCPASTAASAPPCWSLYKAPVDMTKLLINYLTRKPSLLLPKARNVSIYS